MAIHNYKFDDKLFCHYHKKVFQSSTILLSQCCIFLLKDIKKKKNMSSFRAESVDDQEENILEVHDVEQNKIDDEQNKIIDNVSKESSCQCMPKDMFGSKAEDIDYQIENHI